jgi:hypothetical protein
MTITVRFTVPEHVFLFGEDRKLLLSAPKLLIRWRLAWPIAGRGAYSYPCLRCCAATL